MKGQKSLHIQTKRLLNASLCKHHIVVVGTQECWRSIALSFFCDSKLSWEDELQSELGDDYLLIESSTLNAMHLAVFAHESILPSIHTVVSSVHRTGLFGCLANKGGCSISLNIANTSFLFTNVHLPSGKHKTNERTAKLNKIILHDATTATTFDHIILLGDLNYLLEVDSPADFSCLSNNLLYFPLQQLDQL